MEKAKPSSHKICIKNKKNDKKLVKVTKVSETQTSKAPKKEKCKIVLNAK